MPRRRTYDATALAPVVCQRCGTAFPQGASATQATGCAASVHNGTIRGHYGSIVLDGHQMTVLPESGLVDGMDPVCDGCIQALVAVGLLVQEAFAGYFGDGEAIEDFDGVVTRRVGPDEDILAIFQACFDSENDAMDAAARASDQNTSPPQR